ncbi:MAG: hypothetical protein NTY10_02410, partial [Candidatus Omnitrophica bacterium]|nr:hypothetical protein [Candidatus Omnitrophota bacterium]
MILKNRLVGILSVLLIVGFGLACSGGGGSNGSVLPTLPDGKLYFSQNGWVQIIPSFPYQALAEYLPADTAQLDASTALTIPNDYGAPFWVEGYEFWGGAYGEDGFIMAVEPDNPSESIPRLSVALHNYGINLLPEATAFIQADPAHNLFPVIEIMSALSGSGGGISTNGRYVNFT